MPLAACFGRPGCSSDQLRSHQAEQPPQPPRHRMLAVSPEPLAMWTRGDDKLLEWLLFRHPRWDVITARLLGKTPEQACQRYERAVEEVTRVLQALEVDTPREWDTQIVVAAPPAEREAVAVPTAAADVIAVASSAGVEVATDNAVVPTSSAADGEAWEHAAKKTKRRGTGRKPEKWTKEEHNLFLEGLEKYGKSKWKEMSIEYLTTKSATQIACHHRKYCIRFEQRKRNGCKRSSIHDITAPTRTGGSEPAAQKDERGKDACGIHLLRLPPTALDLEGGIHLLRLGDGDRALLHRVLFPASPSRHRRGDVSQIQTR